MIYLQVVVGFLLLLGGAEVMVRGAVAIAEKFGISHLVIGMTVIALGTSAPEAVVSINAGIAGAPGLAIGNVVGSNIANIFLIMGVVALAQPILTKADPKSRDSLVLVGSTVFFIGVCWFGVIDFWLGALLLAVFAGFLGYTYWRETSGNVGAEASLAHEVEEFETLANRPIWMAWAALFVGLGGLLWGSDLLVDGAILVARVWSVSEEVIGLTMVALGTSLPELAASTVAAVRGHSDVAVGNVVGSNIFNLLFVIGLASMVIPIPVAPQILAFDIWIMLIATAALLPFLSTGRTFDRTYGAIFLVAYASYIAIQAYGVETLLALAS